MLWPKYYRITIYCGLAGDKTVENMGSDTLTQGALFQNSVLPRSWIDQQNRNLRTSFRLGKVLAKSINFAPLPKFSLC
jgi:hypothetical protein